MRALSLIFLLALFLLPVYIEAQSTRTNNAAGRMADFENQRRKADRDSMEREMRDRKPTKEELQNAARIKAQTKEDLEGLQLSYNDIVLKLSGRQQPESSFVAEAASKVNKHANRLKANINFPKPEKEEESMPIEVAGDTRRQLHDLCTRIYEFLTNPIVENPNVLDLEAAAKARTSLDQVIARSEKLKAV